MIDLLDLHKQFILTHIKEGDTVFYSKFSGENKLDEIRKVFYSSYSIIHRKMEISML